MTEKRTKRPNRAQRLLRLLRTGPVTAWEIIHSVGTASPSKVVSEVRKLGHRVITRRGPQGYIEYRVAR